jgi:hypothetical protein
MELLVELRDLLDTHDTDPAAVPCALGVLRALTDGHASPSSAATVLRHLRSQIPASTDQRARTTVHVGGDLL